jgi:hypothetical protein
MQLQEETIEEAWERHADRVVSLNSKSGNLQGGEKHVTRIYVKVPKLTIVPSDIFNDSTPHCLQSPKLVAPSKT